MVESNKHNMRIEYDPNLVEQAVFFASRHGQQTAEDLHATIDPLYELTEAEQREGAFRRAFSGFFVKFGLDRVLASLLDEQPLIAEGVPRCIVRKAKRQKAETAELLVQKTNHAGGAGGRTLVIQACPESLVKPEDFKLRLRRELLHVADMLDSQFDYVLEAIPGAVPKQNLIRDRYRVLWDIYVEGRLWREKKGDDSAIACLRQMLKRAFSCAEDGFLGDGFDRVFNAPVLTHRQLFGWACAPDTLGVASEDSAVKQVFNCL